MAQPAAQHYAIAPAFETEAAAAAFAVRFAARGPAAACLLLRFATDDPRGRVNIVKAAAPVQQLGTAVIVHNDIEAALRGGADGVHVDGGMAAIVEAVQRLKPDRIVGAGGLASRDAAMQAGEAGVDYVMFGEPLDGVAPPAEAVLARAAWWAELFEVPGVAFAGDDAAARQLAETGIEFVARLTD
jgi:thiamine-phosphate pyrophosphorylase